jgi:hypothetical protein
VTPPDPFSWGREKEGGKGGEGREGGREGGKGSGVEGGREGGEGGSIPFSTPRDEILASPLMMKR